MALKLSTLFKSKSTPVAASITATNVPAPSQNSDNKRPTETYSQWGKRICATAFAGDVVLQPFLHNVYNYIKREQAQDEIFQERARAGIEAQIKQNENNIEQSESIIRDKQNQIEKNQETLKVLDEKKLETQSSTYRVNKEARAKVIVGLVILVPLTIYLFLFYSSTFYSAFLADSSSGITSASAAMFRPDAFADAWQNGKLGVFFMVFFPVVFLGLGFILHYFAHAKDDRFKVYKVIGLITVTFIFDCILAYKIGETIHNSLVNNGLIEESAYGASTAVKDVSFWAVIFCGFIAYIIWGIVFDLVQDGYNKLDQNKLDIQAIDNQMYQLKQSNNQLKADIEAENKNITNMKNENTRISVNLIGTTFFNEGAIRTEMTNFFSGWVAQMAFLGKDDVAQAHAQQIFIQTLVNLGISNNNNNQ